MGAWSQWSSIHAIAIMGMKIVIRSDGPRHDCNCGHENCCPHIVVILHNNVIVNSYWKSEHVLTKSWLSSHSVSMHITHKLSCSLRPTPYPSATFSQVVPIGSKQSWAHLSSPAPFHISLLHHFSPSLESHTSSSLENATRKAFPTEKKSRNIAPRNRHEYVATPHSHRKHCHRDGRIIPV